MNELRILLAAGYTVALRVAPEGPVEVVTARSDQADTQPLRLTLITGLDPDLDYEVEPVVTRTLDEGLRAALSLSTARRA